VRSVLLTFAFLCTGCADCGRPLEIGYADLATSDDRSAPDAATIIDGSPPGDASSPPDQAMSDAALARSWQPAVPMAPQDPDQAYAPAVALNNAGAAMVAWRVNRNATPGYAAVNRFDLVSQTWGVEEPLPLSASLFTIVSLGLDESGQASAYQCASTGELAGFDPTTATWTQQAVPSPVGSSCVDNVAMPSSTSIVALWEPPGGPTASLWAGRYDLLGWTQTAQIDNGSIAVIDGRAIAATSTGAMAAVWRGYFPTVQLHTARFDPTTHAWSTAMRLDDGSSIAADVDIAIVPSGDIITVWDDASVSHLGKIWARRYNAASATWLPQEQIGSNGAGPQLAYSASGTAIVLWSDTAPGLQPTSTSRLEWTRLDTNGWSTPTPLNVGPGGAGDGHVAMNDAGVAVAAWVIVDGQGHHSVWASRFE
jgi:hypothetical protein